MTLDHLLLWLSSKGDGSWSQFRSAVEQFDMQQASIPAGSDSEEEQPTAGIDLPLYQQVRFAMQRLGHVEFYTNEAENGWRIVPPVAAFFVDAPAQALLCGARSPELLHKIHHLTGIDVSVSDIEGGPSRILLRGSSPNVVVAHARALGIHVQNAASMAILSVVPSARDPRAWNCLSIPENRDWTVHRFSASRLQWIEFSQADAMSARNGLFRFIMGYQRFYFLRRRGTSYCVPVQVGKYAVMRRRRGILKYDTGRHVLTAPAVCRPPLLIERALVLCSGLLPHFDARTGHLEYVDIPQEVARVAAQLLGQEI